MKLLREVGQWRSKFPVYERQAASAATTSGSEGEIAFAAWTDDSQTGGDPSGRAVRGRPLAIPPGGF